MAVTHFTDRYLIYFGYIGTKFRGIQKCTDKWKIKNDCSIGYQIENALNKIDPYSKKNLLISSRTDAGVHALKSSAHFDILIPHKLKILYGDDKCVSASLNNIFKEDKNDIRVFNAIQVPSTFNSVIDAKSRKYMYRIGVINEDSKVFSDDHLEDIEAFVPLAELNRTHIIRGPLNITVMKKACEVLIGTHDFGSFTNKRLNYSTSSIRNLYEADITPCQPLMNPIYDPLYNGMKFYRLIFHANSFCYRQIRRMVSMITAIGKGTIELDFIKTLLENPSKDFSEEYKFIQSSPAYGLYLIDVIYLPEVFTFENNLSFNSHDNKLSL